MWLINKVHLSDQKPQRILNQHADLGAKRDVDFKKKKSKKGVGVREGWIGRLRLADANYYI